MTDGGSEPNGTVATAVGGPTAPDAPPPTRGGDDPTAAVRAGPLGLVAPTIASAAIEVGAVALVLGSLRRAPTASESQEVLVLALLAGAAIGLLYGAAEWQVARGRTREAVAIALLGPLGMLALGRYLLEVGRGIGTFGVYTIGSAVTATAESLGGLAFWLGLGALVMWMVATYGPLMAARRRGEDGTRQVTAMLIGSGIATLILLPGVAVVVGNMSRGEIVPTFLIGIGARAVAFPVGLALLERVIANLRTPGRVWSAGVERDVDGATRSADAVLNAGPRAALAHVLGGRERLLAVATILLLATAAVQSLVVFVGIGWYTIRSLGLSWRFVPLLLPGLAGCVGSIVVLVAPIALARGESARARAGEDASSSPEPPDARSVGVGFGWALAVYLTGVGVCFGVREMLGAGLAVAAVAAVAGSGRSWRWAIALVPAAFGLGVWLGWLETILFNQDAYVWWWWPRGRFVTLPPMLPLVIAVGGCLLSCSGARAGRGAAAGAAALLAGVAVLLPVQGWFGGDVWSIWEPEVLKVCAAVALVAAAAVSALGARSRLAAGAVLAALLLVAAFSWSSFGDELGAEDLEVRRLRRRAQRGEVSAMVAYADRLQHGLGAVRSPLEAQQWYRRAADTGDPEAMFRWALHLETRDDWTIPDEVEMRVHYAVAAKKGHARAAARLARLDAEAPR